MFTFDEVGEILSQGPSKKLLFQKKPNLQCTLVKFYTVPINGSCFTKQHTKPNTAD